MKQDQSAQLNEQLTMSTPEPAAFDLAHRAVTFGLQPEDALQLGLSNNANSDESEAFDLGMIERETEKLLERQPDKLRDLPEYDLGAKVVSRVRAYGAVQ